MKSMKYHLLQLIAKRSNKVCNTQTIGLVMWWRTTIYFVMLGCVYADETVSTSVEGTTTSSIQKSSTVTSNVNVTATSTTDFPSTQNFTLSPSTDAFLLSSSASLGKSAFGINESVFTTTVDVSKSDNFSTSLETTMKGYDSISSTLQSEPSASTQRSPVISVEPSLLSTNFSIQMESKPSYSPENFSTTDSLTSPSTLTTFNSSIVSSFLESSSSYLLSSATEIVSTTTPSLASVTTKFTNMSSPASSSVFTHTGVVLSPTHSEVVPSSQSVNTSVVSTSYSVMESTTLLPVLSQNDSSTDDMETTRGLSSSSIAFAPIVQSTPSSVYPTSSQILQNISESLGSSLLLTGNKSSSLQAITKISPQTTGSDLESVPTQITNATHFISSTSSGRANSAFSFISRDIINSRSQAASSIFIYPKEFSTQTSFAPTSVEEISLQTQPPSSFQASIYPTSIPSSPSKLSSDSVFATFTHSISSTRDTIAPQSTSLYFRNVTSSSAYIITTTTKFLTTTQTTDETSIDLVLVNHTFEMTFQGKCEPLVEDKSLLKTFWDQLQEKIIHRLNYQQISVSAENLACDPLRISFTLYRIPEKNFTLIFRSLKEIASYIKINVSIFGQMEHYKAVKVNMAPTVMENKDKLEGLEELDLIVLIAAGAFCLVLVFAGLVICIRESYRRKRTRTFELANKYQAEDFTLTKIPRPAVNYTEKGGDIHSNGHNNGDPINTERETLMDSIHLRVNSNENGLMVGITGTLERQKAEPDSSPSPSVTDSEHLKVPLVSRQDEPLQSQDNPIYYIDDEHND